VTHLNPAKRVSSSLAKRETGEDSLVRPGERSPGECSVAFVGSTVKVSPASCCGASGGSRCSSLRGDRGHRSRGSRGCSSVSDRDVCGVSRGGRGGLSCRRGRGLGGRSKGRGGVHSSRDGRNHRRNIRRGQLPQGYRL
jgi:hypothetical protein